MDACINWVVTMIDEGYTPVQIRVRQSYQTALLNSQVFSGDSPMLPDSSILSDALPGEINLIVLVHNGLNYRAVLAN